MPRFSLNIIAGATCMLAFFFVPPLMAQGVSEKFEISSKGKKILVEVQSPPAEKLAQDPLLLLNFSSDREAALKDGKYGEPARMFLAKGHRVLSFDLPAHGARVDKKFGSGIKGFHASIMAGEDIFALFVEDARVAIDEAIKRKLAQKGRIVACGVSRGGYCALRLAAADSRITAVAALAPATDWRCLNEFEMDKKNPKVAALTLENYADKLAGKRVYMAIGNRDARVGTDACMRLALAIYESESRAGLEKSGLRLLVVDDSKSHSLGRQYRQEGVRFLMGEPAQAEPEVLP